ncbi:MAG: rhodanese-like domain-containing protein [bacterium]|nr:rhodanese-like domain-containing protein [bacterium]
MHIFVDTRPTGPAAASGLAVPGAVPIRPGSFDDDLLEIFDFVGPDDPLVLYDDGGLLGASNIAARLLERGFTDLSIMAGGVAAWQQAGGETSVPAAEREESP